MTDDRTKTGKSPFPFETVLRDGTAVLVRPIRPDDKHLLEIGMERLSKEDRYFRFFRPLSRLSDTLLHQFTDIDHYNHEAICALEFGEAPGNPAGVARYIRNREQTGTAEMAVTVVHGHQGKGLGTLLLAFLSFRAVENGVEEFTAIVLEHNHRIREVLGELGAVSKQALAGELELRIPLYNDAKLYPQMAAGNVFR